MFSSSVTETDVFYSMPPKAQALYFHLGMRADDDGFVASPKRSCGASEKNLELLVSNGYIFRFKSGVIVITDWKVNNFLRKDRYTPTQFQNEFSELKEMSSGRYIQDFDGQPPDNHASTSGQPNGNQPTTDCQPDCNQHGNHRFTQYRLGKDSIERSSKKDATAAAPDPRTDTGLAAIIQHFQEAIGDFPRSALDKLQRWREVYSTELICKAIDEAAENNVRKWRYVDGILKSWQVDGVRTLGDVEARRESRKKPGQAPEKKREMLT